MPAAIAALRGLPGGRVVPVRGRRPTGDGDRSRPAHGRARPAEPAFPSTTRWLRGRIVDRARDADDGDWVPFDDAIGTHDRHAVREAVVALAGEGLLEMREAADGPEARLPA